MPDQVSSVIDNENCKILWNFPIPTTSQLSATKPDLVIFDRKTNEIFLIEFSCPAEYNMAAKDAEKKAKYEGLVFDMQKQYPRQKVKLVVLLVGVLGGIEVAMRKRLESVPHCQKSADFLLMQCQKAVLLGSMNILRHHLGKTF